MDATERYWLDQGSFNLKNSFKKTNNCYAFDILCKKKKFFLDSKETRFDFI